MRVLLTGAGGMLGSYIREVMPDYEIVPLGKRDCDLTCEVPRLDAKGFDMVIHAAGTLEAAEAVALNLDGTRRLLQALDTLAEKPRYFVFISDVRVYGRAEGESIGEETPLVAAEKVGQSKILAEKEVTDWCERNDVTLTILRPAPMFGSGVHGEMDELFREVLSGRYIHIRGNEAKLSLVTAYDVARAIRSLYEKGGIYNVTDGRPARLIDIAESMSANLGARKRMWHLPEKWAKVGGMIPGLGSLLDADRFARRAKTLTFDSDRFASAVDWQPFDTLEVLARKEKNYPYRD